MKLTSTIRIIMMIGVLVNTSFLAGSVLAAATGNSSQVQAQASGTSPGSSDQGQNVVHNQLSYKTHQSFHYIKNNPAQKTRGINYSNQATIQTHGFGYLVTRNP